MDKVFGIWSEWNIGFENRLFSTKQKALDAVVIAFEFQGVGYTVEEARIGGLLGVNEFTVE